MTSRPGPELQALIGEDAFLRLAEAFGGTRLFVPTTITAKHEIAKAIGLDAAKALSARLAPDVIIVPLAREQRAMQYRAQGMSNAKVARALGITEKAVEKLFQRRPDAPLKGSGQQRRLSNGVYVDGCLQLDMFPD
jgi:DNA-binding transcriptional regulator LsrR (DeoR family)